MSAFDDVLRSLQTEDYPEKVQLLHFLLHNLKQIKRLRPDDQDAVTAYVCWEVDEMLAALPAVEDYRRKDSMFECEDVLLGILMHLHPNSETLPAGMMHKLERLAKLVDGYRSLEAAIDKLFEMDSIDGSAAGEVIALAEGIEDDYRRGKLYAGLVHYHDRYDRLTRDARARFAAHIEGAIDRYLCMESKEARDNLELLADLCRQFPTDATAGQLEKLLCIEDGGIRFFAAGSVLALGLELRRETAQTLASDLEYANLTYDVLKQHGKSHLFPAELATEEYLAKSDLVHWLTYPTELGEKPDEIEYIGKVTWLFKKDVYHLFRFRSHSSNLAEEDHGKWLIGWSGSDGGTFSNFDHYDDYARPTVEATLKNIKKKLLG